MPTAPPSYSSDPTWSDIIPIAQDDGGPNPLAAIAYTDEYSEAMSYLRAVMAKDEFSDRTLELTRHIIGLNPAHYTVWYNSLTALQFQQSLMPLHYPRLYRAKILFELQKDLREEIQWLNTIALRYQKNYQIW